VGDTVEVPGGMHGTVKFVGQVDGKKGIFAGVQLAPEYAARGKNSGEVDGKSYFRTTKPGSGIFLPVEKAIPKATPGTPQGSSLSNFNQGGRTPLAVLPKPNFSQSIGPGARAASPALKPTGRRPSLPRPQSPVRQTPAKLATPKVRPSIGLAKSQIGTGPQYRASPAAKSSKFSASLRGTSATTPTKKQLSPLGPELAFDEEPELTPTPTPAAAAVARSIDSTMQEEEIKRLKACLEEKDRQLKEQASSLNEMEKSLTELQALLPTENDPPKHRRDTSVPDDVAQLRAMLREKNEKIQIISAEFDAHRADFRSTIDTLEMASTETERVYEQRVDELLQQVRELQDRGEDVESVAQQFKQLEELVQELEEGLENSRRGEAEARGEVEFLRGEVERSRSELRQERERAASSGRGILDNNADESDLLRDLEQRDDEIRGLKAIIHSLNRDSMISTAAPGTNGLTNGYGHAVVDEKVASLERKIKELEALIERKAYREEELESELDRLRSLSSVHPQDKHKSASTVRSHRLSDRTVVPGVFPEHAAPPPPRNLETMHEGDSHSTMTDGSALWCEICETGGHDILTCTNMFGNQESKPRGSSESQRTGRDVVVEGLKGLAPPRQNHDIDRPAPLATRKSTERLPHTIPTLKAPDPNDQGMVAGKNSGVIDEQKWCALCERDGHESVDCPFEDAF
jgi:uncharacterized protein YcbK (DUF882 family)